MSRGATFSIGLAQRCAAATLAYPFQRWGFAEEIALWGLIESGEALPGSRYVDAVAELVGEWAKAGPTLSWRDHVAPGTVILELHRRSGDEVLLHVARQLGRLYERYPRTAGVPHHRPDLDGWEATIWVDCMMIDGPFLLRLARVTGEARWRELAVEHLETYHACLFDPDARLYAHGFDLHEARRSPVHWGRGNAWALLGMVEAARELRAGASEDAAATLAALRERIETLAAGLIALQDASGAWHTVLDDPATPLEGSTPALFATALMRARRFGILGDMDGLEASVSAALLDLSERLGDDGKLLVSAATPIGKDSKHYATQPLGVYPWGQGPALLAIRESWRRDAAATEEDA